MPVPDADRLRSIKSFPQLVAYLRDELDWPIDSDDFDDLTFEYTADELGLDPKAAVKIKEIKQLRPLDSRQPWGIFFVNFEPKRLPVVVLRRILRALVVKKRQSANKGQQAAWQLHDLLFISSYGESDHRDIALAHFSEDTAPLGGDLPTLKVLGWDDEDTVLHLDHAQRTLYAKLRWPDDPSAIDTWRRQWSAAFTLRHGETIRTSRDMAVRLAALAQQIRKRANTVLAHESERGPLRSMHAAFQAALIHDLTPDDFADMYAQTIAYGLLTARLSRYGGPGEPGVLNADDIHAIVPVTNPFLRDLLETFLHAAGRRRRGGVTIDFDELGINDVVEMLRAANMEAVLRDFGDQNPEEDPVIHFYELFLKEYDAKKRMRRGVFYTPRPVVSYIVRSVHELLQTEFGLEDGLADTTTWGEMLREQPDLKLPEIEVKDEKTNTVSKRPIAAATPFVQILDPATGTATFLVEVIDVIYKTMRGKWLRAGHMELEIPRLWNEYVPRHLLPRLHGYELMMAPYAIAHMKIGLKLYESGYRFGSNERAGIYLTNALEPPQDFPDTFEQMAPALAHEAKAVNDVKRHQAFTVVVGNPPYSVSSWNTGDWITDLVEDYKRTVRGEESQIQSLSNDYIKFLRLAEWQIERARSGIVGMITGHGYLHGTQPRDLRDHLSTTFAKVVCLDLHGSIRRTGTNAMDDEPVFEIMTGVGIIIALARSEDKRRGIAMLSSLTGRLATKFAYLAAKTAADTTAACIPHAPAPRYFHFAAASTAEDVATEYQNWMDLPVIFGTGNRSADKEVFWATGFASQQDDLAPEQA